ncbi:MAG: rod shape-determining protein MreC, partial [Candidatus Omnitrophota bacterium]
EIIGRSYSGFESFIIIDRGQADGITAAMSLAKDEGLLGRVFEVGRNASKVMLIDDPNSRVSVAIQRTREQGTLIGMGAGLCKIMYLSPASDVQPGDIVISSGLGALDPKGVIVGEVEKVIREPRALDTSALVRPSCDLFKIEEALCIE